MTKLSRATILAANDAVTEDVDCAEWGGSVTIRNMTATERGVFVQRTTANKTDEQIKEQNFGNHEALLVALTAINEDGTRMFEEADTEALSKKNSAPITRCAEVAMRLSGLSKDAKAAATKNFEPAAS